MKNIILFAVQTFPSELTENLKQKGIKPIKVFRNSKSYNNLLKGKLPKLRNYAFLIFGINVFFEVKDVIDRTPIIFDTVVSYSKMRLNLRHVYLIDGKLTKDGYIIFNKDINYNKIVKTIKKPFDGKKIELIFELKKAKNFGVGSTLSSRLNSFLLTIPEVIHEQFLQALAKYILTKDVNSFNYLVDEERLVTDLNKREFEALVNSIEQLKEYFDYVNPNIKKDKKEMIRFRNLCARNHKLGGDIRRLRWIVKFFG